MTPATQPARAVVEAPAIPVAAAPAPLDLNQSSIGTLTADRVEMHQGAVARAQVREFSMRQGAVALVEARSSVHLEQSMALGVVAGEVEIGQGSTALLVVAREVHGDVRPLIDWRGALAVGGAFGLVVALLRRRRP